MDDPGEFPRVNQSGLDLGGLGFGAAGQLFRDAAVGASLHFMLDAIGIDVAVVPNAAAFS
ncbi:MAG TPA: hypothetical protein VK395_28800 [Gemmataceae bacterium]|nr:hypothetical protein [Gemmataceae bacterium]